jgi:hypothetical protein
LKSGLGEAFKEGSGAIENGIKKGFSARLDSNNFSEEFLKNNPAFASVVAPVDKLATSAQNAAETLDRVSKSSAWQDIFGKEKVTARAADFDEYARLARDNIMSGSMFAQSNINTLKDILQTSVNNQGQVFTNQGTFGNVDIQGMQEVIQGLEALVSGTGSGQSQNVATTYDQAVTKFGSHVDKLVESNSNQPTLGNLSLDLTTDTGKIAGEIWAEPEFAARLKDFFARMNNNAARQYTG